MGQCPLGPCCTSGVLEVCPGYAPGPGIIGMRAWAYPRSTGAESALTCFLNLLVQLIRQHAVVGERSVWVVFTPFVLTTTLRGMVPENRGDCGRERFGTLPGLMQLAESIRVL